MNSVNAYFKIKNLDIDNKEIYSESTKSAILNQESLFEFNENKNKISNLRFTSEDTSGSILFKRSILELFNINDNEKYEVTLFF